MPGPPVVCHGDETGMGDKLVLYAANRSETASQRPGNLRPGIGDTQQYRVYLARRFAQPSGMPNQDVLRARVEECRQFARLARDEEMRQRWLKMAEEWTQLADLETVQIGVPVD
jgi:hypothetical protein